jgi:hypothetical protein
MLPSPHNTFYVSFLPPIQTHLENKLAHRGAYVHLSRTAIIIKVSRWLQVIFQNEWVTACRHRLTSILSSLSFCVSCTAFDFFPGRALAAVEQLPLTDNVSPTAHWFHYCLLCLPSPVRWWRTLGTCARPTVCAHRICISLMELESRRTHSPSQLLAWMLNVARLFTERSQTANESLINKIRQSEFSGDCEICEIWCRLVRWNAKGIWHQLLWGAQSVGPEIFC